MRLLRGLLGALLWLGAALLGLVGLLLCVTLILLPLGIPILGYARRMFTTAVRLMLPRAIGHPVKELRHEVKDEGAAVKHQGKQTKRATGHAVGHAAKRTRKAARRARKRFA